MTANEFIQKLSKKYKEPADIDLQDIKKWTERYNLVDAQYTELYEIIIESHVYKTLPSLADIKKWWMGRADSNSHRGASMQAMTKTVLGIAKDMSIVDIIKMYKACRDDEHVANDSIAIRTHFVDTFAEIYNWCALMKDDGDSLDAIVRQGEKWKSWLYEGATG